MSSVLAGRRVIVTGGEGFLGRSVVRAARQRGADVYVVRRKEWDLCDARACAAMLRAARGTAAGPVGTPAGEIVIHCAGHTGGIGANRARPGDFFHDNLVMGVNLIEAARRDGIIDRGGAIVQIGTMCSYPARASLPLREDEFWDGYPDAASSAYGVAKRALQEMLRAFHAQHGMRSVSLVPVNLYGPGDNIADEANAHVAGTLVRRFVEAVRAGATSVVCWGSGKPTRDFLFVEDAAAGVVRAAERVAEGGDPCARVINLGSGREVTIRELAETVARAAEYRGVIEWDTSKPDGQARRCMDVTRAKHELGWEAGTNLDDGIRLTVEWYRDLLDTNGRV